MFKIPGLFPMWIGKSYIKISCFRTVCKQAIPNGAIGVDFGFTQTALCMSPWASGLSLRSGHRSGRRERSHIRIGCGVHSCCRGMWFAWRRGVHGLIGRGAEDSRVSSWGANTAVASAGWWRAGEVAEADAGGSFGTKWEGDVQADQPRAPQ